MSNKSKEKKQYITITSIVFMNFAALLGIRWFSTAGQYGAGSIILWIVAAAIFFVPMALICAEFSSIFPDSEGGMIGWIKSGLGDKPAYYASWMYYVSFYFYFPSVLTFVAVALSYAINPALASNKLFVTSFVIISYWAMTFIVLKGYKTATKFASCGGLFGVAIPIAAIILLALISVFILKNPIPTSFAPSAWIPKFTSSNLLFLSTMALALAGVEISSPFAQKMKNPAREYPKAIILSAILVTAGYIAGTVSLTLVFSPEQIGAANGILEVIMNVTTGIGFSIVGNIICVMIAYASLAATCIFIYGIAAFLINGNGKEYLPEFITRRNKDDMPYNIIFIQGVIITIIMLATSTLESVESIYTVLIMVETVLMFIPYIILIVAYIKVKLNPEFKPTFSVPGNKIGAGIAVILVTFLSLVAILIPYCSHPKGESMLEYESILIISPLVLISIGWIMKTYASKKHRK